MRCVEFTIPIKKSEPITIFCFGDMQFGVDEFDWAMWNTFKDVASKNTAHPYYIGLGDYSDWCRPSVEVELKKAHAKDGAQLKHQDRHIKNSDYKDMYHELEFMKDRIIVLNDGHHNWTFQDGRNLTQMLCGDLHANYGTWMAYSKIRFVSGSHVNALKVLSMHGSGNSLKNCTDMGWMENRIFPYWIADIYLRGHSTKLNAVPFIRTDLDIHRQPFKIEQRGWMANCGGFSSAYVAGDVIETRDGKLTKIPIPSSYVEKAGLPPAPRGWVEVRVRMGSESQNAARERNRNRERNILLCDAIAQPSSQIN